MTQAFRCIEVDRFVDPFIDGEFSDVDRTALEQHLGECAGCARQVRSQAAFKAAIKTALQRPPLPPGLEARVRAAIDAEARELPGARVRRVAWVVLPAAAAFIVGLVSTYQAPTPVVTDAIATYQRDLPVEVAGGDAAVRAWFANKVDFAVRPPQLPNAELVGARLAHVGPRQAAYLVYNVGGDKVTLMMFDPRDLPMEGARRRLVGDREVYLDGQRGYHVAAFRDRDLGYVFTSDMDEERMLELVSTAVRR